MLGLIVAAMCLGQVVQPERGTAPKAERPQIRVGQEGRFEVSMGETHAVRPAKVGRLEDREIYEFASPVAVSSMGKAMAEDSRGRIWYVETREDTEVRIDPVNLTTTTFRIPSGAAPYSIAIDKNDVHWLTAHGIEMLIESHPETGYCISHQPPSHGFLIHINVNPEDNSVWFCQPGANQVVRYKDGEGFREFVIPTRNAGPGRMDFDGRGHLWVPEIYTNKLARLEIATGAWREWDLPTPNAVPAYCRVDHQLGVVWVSEPMTDKLASFRDGAFVREYEIPTRGSVVSTNATDHRGRVWFTEGGWRGSAGGNKIGVLDPESGRVAEFELPTANAQPLGLILARDGTMWFEESTAGKIGILRRVPAGGAEPAKSAAIEAELNR